MKLAVESSRQCLDSGEEKKEGLGLLSSLGAS